MTPVRKAGEDTSLPERDGGRYFFWQFTMFSHCMGSILPEYVEMR